MYTLLKDSTIRDMCIVQCVVAMFAGDHWAMGVSCRGIVAQWAGGLGWAGGV